MNPMECPVRVSRGPSTSLRVAQDDSWSYFAAINALLSRALRRSAALRWMMPRLAALSIAEMTARIRVGSGFAVPIAPFWSVRSRVKTLLLRSERPAVWRARLAADFVLAILARRRSTPKISGVKRLVPRLERSWKSPWPEVAVCLENAPMSSNRLSLVRLHQQAVSAPPAWVLKPSATDRERFARGSQ